MGRREGREKGRGGKRERERERKRERKRERERERVGGGRWEVGGGRWEVGGMIEQRKRGGSRRDDIAEGEKEGIAGEIRQKRKRRREVGVATK